MYYLAFCDALKLLDQLQFAVWKDYECATPHWEMLLHAREYVRREAETEFWCYPSA